MTMKRVIAAAAGVPLCVILLAGSSIAAKPFPAPTGWDHVDQTVPAGSPRSLELWQRDSGELKQTLTVVNDSSISYDEILDRIKKNIAASPFKVNLDKDVTCDGKPAHLFELVFGPDGKRITVNRLVLPDGPGSIQVTYTRPEAAPFVDDVKASEAAYCGNALR